LFGIPPLKAQNDYCIYANNIRVMASWPPFGYAYGREAKIVWSGNNRCFVSQEDVIKFTVAIYHIFPDLNGIVWIPEQGFNAKILKHPLQYLSSCTNLCSKAWPSK